jgi:glutamate N-acetyltransferase / amino-acid N-acetyltransferase
MNNGENFGTPLPRGFLAAGINCGVRRYRPDLGIIISELPTVAAGVFTQNTCQAAPVKYSQNRLPANNIKAIITNSGEANAATGHPGDLDNQAMVNKAAEHLGCRSEQILAASTGRIGIRLSLDKILTGMGKLFSKTSSIAENFATAIMTTDLVPKSVYKEIYLSQGKITITGIAKGSGMIHPNMATMLGYLLSDVCLPVEKAHTLLRDITQNSFNMISVDGETSTNDAVFLLANGASGVSAATPEDEELLQNAFEEIAIFLAKCIVRDGEGASKLIEVKVGGLPDQALARHAAKTLISSPLIKTAVYGESPNWGRIVARLGMAPISGDLLAKCHVSIQGHTVFNLGEIAAESPELLTSLKQDTIKITVAFNAGDYHATAWGCDLTEGYVQINADYPT